MDVAVINPFLNAAVKVFKSMFDIDAEAGRPYLLDDLLDHRWEVSGVLGITGAAQGIIAIRVTKLFASKLLDKSGVRPDEGDKSMENGMVAEITNIIAGNAISDFAGKNIDISPPVVVSGGNHRISWPKIAPVVGIPFVTSAGPFEVDVCFKAV